MVKMTVCREKKKKKQKRNNNLTQAMIKIHCKTKTYALIISHFPSTHN